MVERIIIPSAEIGILYYLYLGLKSGDTLLALSGLIGLLVGFGLGLLLYYIGAWASGDVVILAAFSALLPPLAPSTAKIVPPYGNGYPLYPISILFNSILAVFPFIIAYALGGVLIVRKEKDVIKGIFTEGVRDTIEVTLWIMLGIAVTALLNPPNRPLLGLLVTILAFPIFLRYRTMGDALGVAGILYLLYLQSDTALFALLKVLATIYAVKIILSTVKILREKVLVEEVPVEELREWDILGETIHEINGEIKRERESTLERFKKALLTGDFSKIRPTLGSVIASSTAEGLTKEQIEELKKLVEQGRLENRFLRKKAMPFAPAIFLGFLISYFWGDIFWWLELKIMGL
ncbi:A24 family peptidase C-terminal domain-containing protein [Thermococcus peptonophilus]|uniref:A24 family peptidase C-terminal domain-containing protein n=1 Tax=Thermococcus peptonophilus TaxID=53952 RepID=UPI000B06BBE3